MRASSPLSALLKQWRIAAAVPDTPIELQTVSGETLDLEKTVGDLPWVAGYSSVEIIANKAHRCSVLVGGLSEPLTFSLAPSRPLADLAEALRSRLGCSPERVFAFVAPDGAQLPSDRPIEAAGAPVRVELSFFLRIDAADASGSRELVRSGSALVGSLTSSKEERLVRKACGSVLGKRKRSLAATLAPQEGESCAQPCELVELRKMRVNLLLAGPGSQLTAATKEVWPTDSVSALFSKRFDLTVWRDSAPLSLSSSLRSLHLAPHESLLIDSCLQLPLSGDITSTLLLPTSARLLHLRQRLSCLLPASPAALEISLPGGEPLTGPDSAPLSDFGPPSSLVVRVPRRSVRVSYEGRQVTLPDAMEVGASFATVLQAASTALDTELPANTAIECSACHREIRSGQEGLPESCCSASPLLLRLTRFLDVKLVEAEDCALTQHTKVASTGTVADLLSQLANLRPVRLRSSEGLLLASQALAPLANRNRLSLTLERSMMLLVDLSAIGGQRKVVMAWPNDALSTLSSGLQEGGRRALRADGSELRSAAGSLMQLGLKDGDVITVKASGQLTVTPEEGSFKVICYEWGLPNFDLLLPVPVSGKQLRDAICERFAAAGLMAQNLQVAQLQAVSESGEPALYGANNVWVLLSGEKVPIKRLGTPFFRDIGKVVKTAAGVQTKVHVRS